MPAGNKRKHRVGCAEQKPSLLSGARPRLETGKLVMASTEKALRSVVKEPGGSVDAVSQQGVAQPIPPYT